MINSKKSLLAHYKFIEAEVQNLGRLSKPGRWKPEDYIGAGSKDGKSSTLIFLGIRIPQLRKLALQLQKRTQHPNSALHASAHWELWDHVWHRSQCFETMSLSLFFAERAKPGDLHLERKRLLKWIERIDNWAHSDGYSQLIARLLEQDSKTMLPILKDWRSSRNPWKRRQSLVGLFYYSSQRETQPKLNWALEAVEQLLSDKDYYVQKGVGWTLREAWNVYPDEVFEFLKANSGLIPPAGWTAATEKLNPKQKAILKGLRQSYRA